MYKLSSNPGHSPGMHFRLPKEEKDLVVKAAEHERRSVSSFLRNAAVTRAKNELYLSYPLIRMTSRGDGAAMQLISRFVREIPAELMDEWKMRSDVDFGWDP